MRDALLRRVFRLVGLYSDVWMEPWRVGLNPCQEKIRGSARRTSKPTSSEILRSSFLEIQIAQSFSLFFHVRAIVPTV